MIIIIRLLGYLVAILASWALVVALPCWALGAADCRAASACGQGQRMKGYLTVKRSWLAALLVPRWLGYNEKLHINLPLFNNRFWLNPHPQRLGWLGVVNWCLTLPMLGWYIFELTRFYIQRDGLLVVSILLLLGRTLVMTTLTAWNWGKEPPVVSMTRKERRQWKRAYRWAQKER